MVESAAPDLKQREFHRRVDDCFSLCDRESMPFGVKLGRSGRLRERSARDVIQLDGRWEAHPCVVGTPCTSHARAGGARDR